MIQSQQHYAPNNLIQGVPMENNNTGETSEMR